MQSFKDIDEGHQEVSADFKLTPSGKKVPVQRKNVKDEGDVEDNDDKEMKEARLPVTHEDPLVTVHDKHGLHTHANLSVANHIMQTKVKHTDVHKGPVKVKSGGSYGNVTFAISQHHAKDVVKEETHRVSVTVTDPHHPATTMRSVKHEKRIRVNADSQENAVQSAVAYYQKRGYKVHDQNYIGVHKEETEYFDDGLIEGLKPGWMLKADPELAKKLKDKIDLAKKRQATYGDKNAGKSVMYATATKQAMKEEVEQIDELDKSTLASYATKAADSAHTFRNTKRGARRLQGIKKAVTRLGAHRDKKKEQKQGYEKHKNQGVAQGSEEGNLYAMALQRYPRLKRVDREIVINALNGAYEDYLMHYGYEGIGPDEESSMIDHAVKGLKQGVAEGRHEYIKKDFGKFAKSYKPEMHEYQVHKEEVELDEKMDLAKANMGDVIKDFQQSDAPQFAGKSVKEEVEQIDEISSKLASNYFDKSTSEKRPGASDLGISNNDARKAHNRVVGSNRALDRMYRRDKVKGYTNEETELDESDKAWAAAQEKEREKKLTPNDQDKLAKVRALMAKERQQKEEIEHIEEAIDKEDMRMLQLARLGLVDKSDVARLRLAVQQLKSEKQLSIVQRTLLLRVLEDLMSLVTGDDQIFMRIKRDVQKESMDNDKDDIPFDGPYKKSTNEPRKDRFGNVIKPTNVAKHLAKLALQKQRQKLSNK